MSNPKLINCCVLDTMVGCYDKIKDQYSSNVNELWIEKLKVFTSWKNKQFYKG